MTLAILILLIVGLVALVAFIYRYARYSPWRATFQGRTLMAQKVAMALLVAYFILQPFVHYAAADIVKLVLVGLLMALFWTTLAGLLLAQTEHRPVSRKHGTGYVPPGEIEDTRPKNNNVRSHHGNENDDQH